MANPFYTHSSAAPVSQTRGTSSNIRLELDLIAAGFDVVANSVLGVGVESGTLNNFLLTLNPLPTAYPAAGTFTFIATHANTGAATFQLGALTAIPLLANDGTALTNNYIVVGEIVQVFTNGANAYVMGATKSYVDATAFSGVLPAQGGNTGKFLVTNGATAFWSSSILLASLGAGTVAAPSLNFGDAGTGLYRPALNQVALAINGVIAELTVAAGKTFYGSVTYGAGIVFPANMTSPQLLALTGAPSATGGGASGTWGISISGNAASASVLSTSLASNGIAASGANNDITALNALAAGGLPANNILTANVAAAVITAPKLSGAQTGTAPVYGVRAWCYFNGNTTGTNAPTAGGNVTSVTRNAVGDYTINFTTAMPNANYAVLGTCNYDAAGSTSRSVCAPYAQAPTASAIRVLVVLSSTTAPNDVAYVYIAILA